MAKGWGIVQDSQGNAIESCEVKVYLAGTLTLASIFSDSALSVAIDQTNDPVTTDATGHYEFFIASGSSVKLVGTKETFTFTEDDVDIGFSVPAARLLSTDPPLTGGGDLSADRTLGFDAFLDVRTAGAAGDGVADDTAEIQAALDTLDAAGGGTLFFPAGQYNISAQVNVPSNVILMGVGYASRIHMTVADTQMFQVAGEVGVGFRDLRLTGQGGFTTPGSGAIRLGLGSANNGATDCWVEGCWLVGVSNSGITIGSQSLRCRVVNTHVESAGEEGVYLLGQQCSVVGCTILSPGNAGIKVSAAVHFSVVGNVIRTPVQQGILLTGTPGAQYGVVTGNSIYGAGLDGIRLADSAADVAIVGNSVVASSQATDATQSNILISGASVARIFLQGNVCRVGGETNGPAYGLRLTTGTDCIVGDNDLRSGGKTGQYTDGATNTQGTHLKARVALASGNTTLTSATDTDIAGCSISVTPLLTQVVTVYAVIDITRVTPDTLTIDLDVNGTDEAGPITMSDAGRQPIFGVWVLSLVGGTAYTIKLQGSLQAGAGEWTVNSAGTKLVLAPGGLA